MRNKKTLNLSIPGWLCLFSGQYLSLILGCKHEGLFLQGIALGFFGTNLIVSYKKLKRSKKNEEN